MLERTEETKVLRDCIHGYIHIDLKVIWDLLATKEVQRLRRINQLGGVFQVYHNAEHSRFTHSLGVYEIVRRMVYEIQDLNERLSDYEKAVVMCAGLLHDIGHLPFSHAFEHVCSIPHEQFSQDVILKDTEVNKVLRSVDASLPQDVADVIAYKHKNSLLNQIISGQLDADRMDYLLRDAYFSGTSYGNFDIERILRTVRVKDEKIVVKESGMHSVEDYIMARYHMYWQVYFHPVARSFEYILKLIFKRMKDIYYEGNPFFDDLKMFVPFLQDNPTIHDHFMLDEHAAYYGFGLLLHKDDEILKDLCQRLLDRKLFEYATLQDNDITMYQEKVKELGYDPNYFVAVDETSKSPYEPYIGTDGHNIYVLTQKREVVELSKISNIVSSLVSGEYKKEIRVFYANKKL